MPGRAGRGGTLAEGIRGLPLGRLRVRLLRVATPGRTDDIHEAIDAMDVAVLASWGEAFGLVVVEAMALGTPVVATSVGGPAEIVREGVDGHLVAPGDAAAMASAIGAILDVLPVNTEDNLLHLVLGLTGLAAGAATPKDASRPARA